MLRQSLPATYCPHSFARAGSFLIQLPAGRVPGKFSQEEPLFRSNGGTWGHIDFGVFSYVPHASETRIEKKMETVRIKECQC